MLYLNPPYPIINNIALFPDHQDPLQWYFMPSAPKLSMIPDPSAQPRPALQLIKFRGDAGVGGFLNFDVNIGVEESVLDDIKGELRSPKYKLPPGAIKLTPVPLTNGTVKLLILGQESPPPTPTPKPGGGTSPGGTATATQPAPDGLPQFVTKISHEAHPSLYGDNQAAFSVMLDQYGVTVLEQALAGNMAPIAVVYSLDYLGLRPAYSVHLSIDWNRVQDHMETHFGASFIVSSVSIDNAIDELIEKRVIVLEADTFVPEGEDNDSVIGNRDRALNECRDMITEAFFTPTLSPVEKDDTAKKGEVAGRIATMFATGGAAGSAMFSYSKLHYQRIDKKALDFNIRERTTVQRSIYPQGHLTGLFQVLRDQNLKMSDFVSEANLNDPWFQRRKVNVISRANYDADSIGSLNVKLTYGNQSQNVILDKQTQRQEVKWLSRVVNGEMEMPVNYEYQVSFQGVDGTERPLQLKSAPDVVTVENLEIEPRSLYSMVPVPVAVSNPAAFPWTRYPRVEVHTEYQDAANGIHDDEVLFLEKDNASKTWSLFVRQQGPVIFRYRLIYRAADNRDYETDWRETDERQVMVRDPFPSKRTVLVVPPGNWGTLDQVFVDLSYEDEKNQVRQEESFNFSQTEKGNRTFSVDLRDPSVRRVAFQVTFMDKNGGVFEIPRSYTLDNRIILRSDMRGHRIIAIRTTKIDFAAKKLKELRLELRYADTDAALQYSGQATLAASTDSATFEFDYVDPAKSRYEYKLSAFYLNGMVQDFDWKSSDADDLNLEL